jgi:ectoine hydroxylase-related dioxygenase (phytanoyl-CoA dioxygenase family)
MILTEKQKTFFKIFGYLKIPGLFADEIPNLSEQFDDVFRQYEDKVVNWVHATHDNRLRRALSDATEKSAYFASLLDDSRIQEVATSLLGSGYQFRGSDVSIYDCGTNFHQDGIDTGKRNKVNIKMALYLEQLDESSGAIRVIPGSHHQGDKYFGLLYQNWIGPDTLELATDEYPATVVPSSPGDLLLWDYRVMHATAYRGNQRRMVAFEFAQAD